MRIRNWDTFLFVVIYHLLLLALLPVFLQVFSWGAVLLFFVTYVAGGLSITAGYHRLYAHRSFTANPVFEWLVLLGSTLALEMSALMWSHDHRLHHNHVDTDKDPYSIKRGFWYAHLLWLFDYRREYDPGLVADLLENPRVAFQHRHFVALTIGVNVVVFLIGCLLVGPLASFYMGVLVRMAAIHHSTWFINSLCHTFGSKTYARELTAVDNALLALVTFGEGYHNYHHAFAADYRNGIRWYHFDPTKWLIWLGARIGLTGKLHTVNEIIVRKRLVLNDKRLILDRLSEEADHYACELRERLEELSTAFEETATALLRKARELKEATREARRRIRAEVRALRAELHRQWDEWLELTRHAAQRYALAH